MLQQVECTKYLGVFIDSNLSWQQNTLIIVTKNTSICIFYKIRHKLIYKMAKMIYFAFMHSYLIYGIEVYGNTHMKNVHRLIILNNKILSIGLLQNKSLDTYAPQLYTNYNILSLPNLLKFQILKIVHKCICYYYFYNRFTALLEFVWNYPGELVPER